MVVRDGSKDPYGDGRYIDRSIGLVTGEGAQQAVPKERLAEGAVPAGVWSGLPTDAPVDEPTYYERPLLKKPVWIWAVPAYFYLGGAAGAAAVLAGAAQVRDRDALRGLVTRCRRLAAASTTAGTALLIYDLGRPERFLNMLRVFRPSSPMSVGSWVLAGAASLASATALLDRSDGFGARVGDAAGYGLALFGMPLSGYSAVLFSATAVPVWQETRRSLPPLFIASAVSSGASLLEMTDLTERERHVVHRFGLLGKIGEIVAMAAVERDASRIERVGLPLEEGVSGALWKASRVLTGASVAAALLPGRSRAKRAATAALATGGALALRFAVWRAGTQSAADPRSSFRQQRAGHGGAEVTGAPAVTGPGGERAAP